MASKRVQAIVRGRVQGVAFREYTRREAVQLGVSGWVRNQPDGTVEVIVEGEPARVDALLAWLSHGSPFSQVTGVEQRDLEPVGEHGEFFIRRFA